MLALTLGRAEEFCEMGHRMVTLCICRDEDETDYSQPPPAQLVSLKDVFGWLGGWVGG